MTRKYAILLLVAISVASLVVFAAADEDTVWHVPRDFPTIQAAIDSPLVLDGDKILVGPGSHDGAIVNKRVEIKGEGGAVIDSGPPYSSWMLMGFYFPRDGGGSGATISHLRFEGEGMMFPVMSGGANDVTVEHCTLIDPIQGISNWCGSGWQISHNEIIDLQTACGGGIGIFIGDWRAVKGGVQDSVVSHNKITGTLYPATDDCGGYDGGGIVLYADFRWGAPGAVAIAYNRVVKNKVSLISTAPDVVNVVAIELTDTRDVVGVVFDNAIGFNDLRGTCLPGLQLAFTPFALQDENKISRNLGDNRAEEPKLHPSAFKPGGN